MFTTNKEVLEDFLAKAREWEAQIKEVDVTQYDFEDYFPPDFRSLNAIVQKFLDMWNEFLSKQNEFAQIAYDQILATDFTIHYSDSLGFYIDIQNEEYDISAAIQDDSFTARNGRAFLNGDFIETQSNAWLFSFLFDSDNLQISRDTSDKTEFSDTELEF